MDRCLNVIFYLYFLMYLFYAYHVNKKIDNENPFHPPLEIVILLTNDSFRNCVSIKNWQ